VVGFRIFILALLWGGGPLLAEKAGELRPKRVDPTREPANVSSPLLRPKKVQTVPPPIRPTATRPRTTVYPVPEAGKEPKRPPAPGESPETRETDPTSLSLNLFTPLLKENIYDARFSTLGLEILGSFPLFHLTESLPVFLETGPGVTYSALTLNQPQVAFSHFYLLIPVRFRLHWMLGNSQVRFELLGGLQLRPFEYDSRSTTDGGFHSTGSFLGSIEPEFGVGIVIPLGERLRFRGFASYLKMAIGLESTI